MNKRLAEIILILLKYDDYITIDEIANLLQVSNRTIRNDLKLLDTLLPPLGLSLVKKTGMGILLNGSIADKLKVYDTFKHSKSQQGIDSPIERHNYILLKLTTQKYYRIFEFVDELYVSRATIHKDLVIIEEYLKKFKIELERSNTLGLSLLGKERDIRNLMFEICASTGASAFASIIKHKDKACTGEFVYQGLDLTDDEINHFIQKSRIKYITNFSNLSMEALSQIAIHLLITMLRSQDDHTIPFSDAFKSELDSKPFQEEAKLLIDSIALAYNLAIHPNEIYYMQIHILAFQVNLSTENFVLVEQFVGTLIQQWSSLFNLDLTLDTRLRNALVSHMIPVYTRIEHQIPVENDLMHEIMQRYSQTFGVVENSIKDIPFWNEMRKEDIGFITLHLAAALEHNKASLQTLLVHGTSQGAKLLLRSMIDNRIPEIEIADEMTIAEFHSELAADYDLIIATVQLSAVSTPSITVNNILTDTDIQRIKEFINPLYKEKNNPRKVV